MKQLILLLCVCILSSCATTMRVAVPVHLQSRAQVAGLESDKIRFWGDEVPANLNRYVRDFRRQIKYGNRKSVRLQENVLLLSGGGADGAFGAGLLNGWSQSGSRPKFELVTGVSTGALMAPFAFLGREYDPLLKEFYTQHSTSDILRPKPLSGIFGGPALSSSAPLADLIAKYVDHKLLRKIAAEYRKGRYLLIGTTNLDSERAVIWNMGEIASVGTDRALDMFRKVILASASIPGLFPPVLIDVVANGQIKQEMHVDGATTDNVILVPVQINLHAIDQRASIRAKRNLYAIVNAKLTPEWQQVKTATMAIAARSISTLIKQQTIGDVHKIYNFARKYGIRFNLASLPASFNKKPEEPFDRAYMTSLFKLGLKMGMRGYQWQKTPPAQ